MNVLVIGKPKYNVVLPLDSYPKEGIKLKINERLEVSAGTSVYVACMLAKWGINVFYAGAVCGDEIGSKIKAEIEKHNVDTKYMEIDYEHKSNINYVLVNKANGSTTEIEHANEVYLKKYKYDILPDYIITDGTDMGASMAAANNYPLAKIILLANKVSDEYYNLSKRASYVCANINYAKALTKMDFEFNRAKSLVNLFQKIKDLNKAEYIIMLRERGVLYTKDRQVKMIPAVNVQKLDDSNSGSSFFGAYCYGILKGYDMDTVAKTANAAGALALTKIGSLTSIPDKGEVYNLAGVKDEGPNGTSQDNGNVQAEPAQNSAPVDNQVNSAVNQAVNNHNEILEIQQVANEMQNPINPNALNAGAAIPQSINQSPNLNTQKIEGTTNENPR